MMLTKVFAYGSAAGAKRGVQAFATFQEKARGDEANYFNKEDGIINDNC